MYLVKTKEIEHFKPVLQGLKEDFGLLFFETILTWCNILSDEYPTLFWEVWVIVEYGKVIGICGLYSLKDETELWLGWLGIIKEKRGKGIGGNVLLDLISKAKMAGAKTLNVYVSPTGPLGYYFKYGFEKIGTVKDFTENGYPVDQFESLEDIVLQLKLV